jgi:lysophospholipase L1-like esterase
MRPAGLRRLRIPLALAAAAAVAAVTAVVASSGSVRSDGAHAKAAAPTYYLALGDSLSQGVQPDAAGVSVETRYGYPDQVYAALRGDHPALQLVKLGCPGETTSTMISGGRCRYRGGSQLAAAVAFLNAHHGRVFLVTIDIGANDPEACGGQPALGTIASCVGTGIPAAVTRLTTIMAKLMAASGPGVRMVGMTYYLPALADWRDGLPGHAVAWLAEKVAATYNQWLDRVYTNSGARVADVFGAFHTADFAKQGTSPGAGTVPRNVALLCQWTWACAAPPRGPNQHANQAGYQVIARTFLQAAGLR